MTLPAAPTKRSTVGVRPRAGRSPGSSAISSARSSRCAIRLTDASDKPSSADNCRRVTLPCDLIASRTRNAFNSAMLPMSIRAA